MQLEGSIKQIVEKLREWKQVQELISSDIRLFESEHLLWSSPELHNAPQVRTVCSKMQEWSVVCTMVQADLQVFKAEHRLKAECSNSSARMVGHSAVCA